jgi:hypothetical protein
MTPEEKTRITEKIKKVLALASDPTITEHEQDNYRRRARILMESYCIAHLEDPIATEKDILDLPFVPYQGLVINRDLFEVLPSILDPIARYFGTFVVMRTRDGARREHFVGFKPNIEMTEYACNVVLRQGMNEFKRLYKLERYITFDNSFWSGFAIGIAKKFKLDGSLSEKGIMLYDRVANRVEEITKGRTASTAIDFSRPDYMAHGQKSGENVVVHYGIESGSGKGGLLK